jgi:transcriptional regulator with XRE-family HTH domain
MTAEKDPAGKRAVPIDPEDKRVGATIKALRDAHGLKLGELAVALGISHAYLSNIEAGRKHAPLATCRQIAKLLRIPLAAITIANYAEIREAAAKSAATVAA